jgi:hypothetical protein
MNQGSPLAQPSSAMGDVLNAGCHFLPRGRLPIGPRPHCGRDWVAAHPPSGTPGAFAPALSRTSSIRKSGLGDINSRCVFSPARIELFREGLKCTNIR